MAGFANKQKMLELEQMFSFPAFFLLFFSITITLVFIIQLYGLLRHRHELHRQYKERPTVLEQLRAEVP